MIPRIRTQNCLISFQHRARISSSPSLSTSNKRAAARASRAGLVEGVATAPEPGELTSDIYKLPSMVRNTAWRSASRSTFS